MKIKYLVAVLAVSALMCLPAQAQDETRHEVSVSYGVAPNSIWINIVGDIFSSVMGATYDKVSLVGPVGLEYHYRVSPLIGVGAVTTFNKYDEEETYKSTTTIRSKYSYFSLMPSVKFNWLRRDHWGMYSKIAAGASLRHCTFDTTAAADNAKNKRTYNDVFFNFQVSALGIEAGSQNVRGFAELGIGEQGVGLAGVRFKF